MSNVTPIRPATRIDSAAHDMLKRESLMSAYFGREIAAAELDIVKLERDTLENELHTIEQQLRQARRDNDKHEREGVDRGRIQGIVAASIFVAIGLTLASVWAI